MIRRIDAAVMALVFTLIVAGFGALILQVRSISDQLDRVERLMDLMEEHERDHRE